MSSSNSKSIWVMIFIVFLIELGTVFLVVPKDTITNTLRNDMKSFQQMCGSTEQIKLQHMTEIWFNTLFANTGVVSTVNTFFFDQWDNNTSTLQLDDRGLTDFFRRRVAASWGALYLFLYRLGELYIWFLVSIPLFICVAGDIIAIRKIHQGQIFSPSPALHATLFRSICLIFIVLLLLFLAPFSFLAEIPPLALLAIALMLRSFSINLSKNF